MYEHQGLQDIFFIMLYGGATWLAILSCCYLLLTRGNLFLSDIKPSRSLRRWSAAFMAAVATEYLAQVNTLIIIGFVHWPAAAVSAVMSLLVPPSKNIPVSP